ncbi:hypothetical protein YTPLAS18_05930 [Nitrospira sp.]|nr:hypothetical protein YTPLAS18_05930 [Nitrospira sp.]
MRDKIGYDAALVEYLKTYHVPATFFISGRWAERHDREITSLRAVSTFELGTHGETHAHLPLLSDANQRQEIARAVARLQSRFGVAAPLFRPPYGEYNDVTVQLVKALGLRFILWDVVSGDPDPALEADEILARISRRIRPGSIVVFHANGRGKHTQEVIQSLTESVLPRKQLRPMTVSELLACGTDSR